MNDNEYNLNKKPENPYISNQEPQGSYQGQNTNPNQGQYPNTQYPNGQYPNGSGQFVPQQQTGGMTNGIWSMIMLGGTAIFTFVFPFLCIATAIAGVVFGRIGWKKDHETLARVGFWINLSSIVFGILIFILFVVMFGLLFGSAAGRASMAN